MPTIEEQHLVLPLSNGKYYYTTIDENDELHRYYSYTEIIIPIDKLENASVDYIEIRFMYEDVSSRDEGIFNESDLDDYYTNTKLVLRLGKETDTLNISYSYSITNSVIAAEIGDYSFEGTISSNIYNKIKINDEFIVLSIMIDPELNNPIGKGDALDSTDYASILFFINRYQLSGEADANIRLCPLYCFYKSGYLSNPTPQILIHIKDNANNKIPYVIWNTEYERFVYKDLAQMCYKEHNKSIIQLNEKSLKYPIFDTCLLQTCDVNKHILPFSIGFDKIQFDQKDSNYNGFVVYKVYKITTTSATGQSLNIALINLSNNDSYNAFNYSYKDYSDLDLTDSIVEQVIRTAKYNLQPGENEKYLVLYIKYVNGNPMFGYGNTTNIDNPFGPTQETVQLLTSNYYTLLITCDTTNNLVQIEDISYSGNIPYPRDITTEEKNSLFMSPNNYHWKSLWKYNRTIEYSSPLQDNPAILPLNVFTSDENENMFVEFIINSGSINHFGIDLFDTCNIEQNSSDINITPSGALFPVNGVSSVYYEGTVRLNVVSNSESVYFSQDTQGITYPVAICFYYNSKTKKLLVERSDEAGPKEVTEITKDKLKNISCHIPGTGSITINFGPTSDYFQDYIDEILDQDNKPTQEIQIINKNIVKDLQFYNISDIIGGDEVDISSDAEVDGVPSYTFETYPYSQATYNVVITIKPPFIAPEDAAKVNESDYLIFSNSNLASYQYSYGVYNTDRMTLGYTLVFNRTHVPESTTEDVKKNNTDIIQISSSDGKYNYKITLKTIDVLKQGYFRFTSFDVPHTTLIDLGEAVGQHSFSAVYNLYFESNISKYFITTDTGQWDEIISNTTIKAIGETSSSEATIIKNIKLIIEYAEPDRYINGRIEFKVNSQDINFAQFNFRFTATYRSEELGIETTDTSPVITIFGSEYTG